MSMQGTLSGEHWKVCKARGHVSMQGTLAHEHLSMQGAYAYKAREHMSMQGMLTHQNIGTWACKARNLPDCPDWYNIQEMCDKSVDTWFICIWSSSWSIHD